MAPKRALGLGQAARAKKQKAATESTAESGADNSRGDQLTVELGEEVDANDSIAQLQALWRNFVDSTERSELMLNGIIHECDRILRKSHGRVAGESGEAGAEAGKEAEIGETGEKDKSGESDAKDDEQIVLNGSFYGIYGLALSMLGFFHTEEPAKVQEFFKEANERISVGFEKFPDSTALLFAQARILINRIPLMEVSNMTLESRKNANNRDSSQSLDECLAIWEKAESEAEARQELHHFNLENSDFLKALDDLLDMVDNFGREKPNGDNDDDDSEDEQGHVVLDAFHPLYSIVQTDKYNIWWREHTIRFLDNLNTKIETNCVSHDLRLRRELNKRLGQSYLLEAETPSSIFTTLAYFEKDKESLNGMTLAEAREATQSLLKTALDHLRAAQDEDEPESWATVAEAMISYANTLEIDSEEQESTYKEAEKLLIRANNATNGQYEEILENLTQD